MVKTFLEPVNIVKSHLYPRKWTIVYLIKFMLARKVSGPWGIKWMSSPKCHLQRTCQSSSLGMINYNQKSTERDGPTAKIAQPLD